MALLYKNGAVVIKNVPTTYNLNNNSVIFVQSALQEAVLPVDLYGKTELDYNNLSAPDKAIVDNWILDIVVVKLNLTNEGVQKNIVVTSQLATYDGYSLNSQKNQFLNCKKIENNKEISTSSMFRFVDGTVQEQGRVNDLLTLTVNNLSA